MNNIDPSSEQDAFATWLSELDLDRPLGELIEQPETLEVPTLSPEELDHLIELGHEYAQELFEREMIPALPALEHEPVLEPERASEPDLDLER